MNFGWEGTRHDEWSYVVGHLFAPLGAGVFTVAVSLYSAWNLLSGMAGGHSQGAWTICLECLLQRCWSSSAQHQPDLSLRYRAATFANYTISRMVQEELLAVLADHGFIILANENSTKVYDFLCYRLSFSLASSCVILQSFPWGIWFCLILPPFFFFLHCDCLPHPD